MPFTSPPQTVAVVRGTLSATSGGTTDFTSAGFGTPAAAIIVLCNANTTNNPEDDAILSVGFWDGTNQRFVSVFDDDNSLSSNADSTSDDSYGAGFHDGTAESYYTVSAIANGIRLTLSVDNTALERYCTVLMIRGVKAKVDTFTPNGTQDLTQASGSLGFAPKMIFFATIGRSLADSAASNHAALSFGFARDDTTHRVIAWGARSGSSDEEAAVLYSETRCVAALDNGVLDWAGEVTTFGSDTFTMTTRDSNTGSNLCFFLALGGANLSFDCGTLTTLTANGDSVVATDVAPDALLLMASTDANAGTVQTDAQANGITIGMADETNEYSHNIFVEDAALIMNTGSVATATTVLDLDTSAVSIRTDLCTATVALNSADFTLTYSATDGTARKGWWVVFGTVSSVQTGTPGVATVTVSGVAPTASGSGTATATPDVATVTVSGVAPSATGSGTGTATPAVATVTVSGIDATATATGTVTVTPGTATVTVSAVDVSATGGTAIGTPAAATVTVSGVDLTPTGQGTATATPAAATVTITGIAPSASGSGTVTVTPDAATVAVSAIGPSASGSGTTTATPASATVTVSGVAPSASGVSVTVAPAVATVTVSGVDCAADPDTVTATPGFAVVTVSALVVATVGGQAAPTDLCALVNRSRPDESSTTFTRIDVSCTPRTHPEASTSARTRVDQCI